MANHDDDVVVIAASFLYFLMKIMLMLDYITVANVGLLQFMHL